MALNITGTFDLGGGISVENGYARTEYSVRQQSKDVLISVYYYKDETIYNDNLGQFTPINAPVKLVAPYDRTTDTNDILLFTNEQIKAQLENYGFSVVITEL